MRNTIDSTVGIRDEWGSTSFDRLVDDIRDRLSKSKFVVIGGLDFHTAPENTRNDFIGWFTRSLGDMVPVSPGSDALLWDVKPQDKPTKGSFRSQKTGHINLHTDNWYASNPPEVTGLWGIKAATDGGDSIVWTADDLTHNVSSACVEALSENFNFKVPDKHRRGGPEFISSPVISNLGRLRLSFPTLKKESHPGLPAKSITELEIATGTQTPSLKHRIKPGEVLFQNNHESAHARTDFNDKKRHLIRVNANKVLASG